MSQSREEKRVESPFEASRLPHYQRPENARALAQSSIEENVAEKAKFYATWTGQETLRDV